MSYRRICTGLFGLDGLYGDFVVPLLDKMDPTDSDYDEKYTIMEKFIAALVKKLLAYTKV